MKIDGKAISTEILNELKIKVQKLNKKGITPTMAVILMGDNEASAIYVKQKGLKAEEIGAKVLVHPVTESTTNQELEVLIKNLNDDMNIHGIILQRPAPDNIKVNELTELVSPVKEIDGFGLESPYSVPVAQAVIIMLKNAFEKSEEGDFQNFLKTKRIAVIGKGETAGQPIIDLLTSEEAKPNVIDSKTSNKKEVLKNADIIITAVGKKVLSPSDIKKGAIVIGVGLYSDENGKLRGDYDNSEMENIAAFFSPTPGGVGPVNVACLLDNLVNAAIKQTSN